MNLYKVTLSFSIHEKYIYVVAIGMDRAGEIAILWEDSVGGTLQGVELLSEMVLIEESEVRDER